MHLFQASNHLGMSDFLPHSNLRYRCPAVPGVLGYELFFGRDDDRIFVIISVDGICLAGDYLGERVGSMPFALVT